MLLVSVRTFQFYTTPAKRFFSFQQSDVMASGSSSRDCIRPWNSCRVDEHGVCHPILWTCDDGFDAGVSGSVFSKPPFILWQFLPTDHIQGGIEDSSPNELQQLNAKFVPAGSEFRWLSFSKKQGEHPGTAQMLRDGERALIDAGVLTSESRLYEGYYNLRPGAFRADLWRAVVLWQYGGMYLDNKDFFTLNVTDWLDLSQQRHAWIPRDADGCYPCLNNRGYASEPGLALYACIIITELKNINSRHQYPDPVQWPDYHELESQENRQRWIDTFGTGSINRPNSRSLSITGPAAWARGYTEYLKGSCGPQHSFSTHDVRLVIENGIEFERSFFTKYAQFSSSANDAGEIRTIVGMDKGTHHQDSWLFMRPYCFEYLAQLAYCDMPLTPLHLLLGMPFGHWLEWSGWQIFFMRWYTLLHNLPNHCAMPKEGTFPHQEIYTATALNSIMVYLVFCLVLYVIISLLVACGTVCFRKIKQLTVHAKMRSESIIELKRHHHPAESIGRHRYNQISSVNVE